MTSIYRALEERNREFGKGKYASHRQGRYRGVVVRFSNWAVHLLMGFISGVVISLVSWLGVHFLGNIFVLIMAAFLTLVLLHQAFPLSRKNRTDMQRFFTRSLQFYLFSILFFLFLITLANYLYLNFVNG
jgi:4-hydroxybenzoate polyprenyltransferase